MSKYAIDLSPSEPTVRRPLLALLVLALASGVAATPAPTGGGEPVRPAFGDESAPIRPGASIGGCTLNWLFYEEVYPTPEEPSPVPTVYAGTAAHCTDEVGEKVRVDGFAAPIGAVVFDSDDIGSAVDFSLIQLYPGVEAHANPKMLGWDGPYGAITTDDLAVGDLVDLHGYGMVLGQNSLTRDRFGALMDWTEDEFIVDMPAVPGDSGAPLLHDATGKALGIISRFNFETVPPSTDIGPLMPFIFRTLEANGYPDVVLATVEG